MNTSAVSPKKETFVETFISSLFGIIVLAIGLINTFWGNDTWVGVCLVVIAFFYFLPVNNILRKIAGFSIPHIGILKIVLGVLIIVATLGVGELFDKDSKKSKACMEFCDCIHNQGKPLDSCLDKYDKAPEDSNTTP